MNIFNYLKDKISFKELFGAYGIPYEEYGADSTYVFKAKCPFDGCKSKKNKKEFTVASDYAMFYCFNCHKTGTVIEIVSGLNHITPIEAAKKLISNYHDWKTKESIIIPKEYEKESRETFGDYFVDRYLEKQNV